MMAIFTHSLQRYRGQIIGWGLGLFLLGLLVTPLYGMVAEQGAQIQQLLESYPEGFLAAFGGSEIDFTTPKGYLTVEYFSYLPLILGIFVILAGSGLLVGDEERGTLDLLQAHPVSRWQLLGGRLLAFVAAFALILLAAWLGLVLPASGSALNLGWGTLALPYLSLFATLLVFGLLATWLSMVLPSRQLAAMVAGVGLVASYFLSAFATLDERLVQVARLLPLHYYQSGEALDGLDGLALLGLLLAALLFAGLAGWQYNQRDLRVAGEGGWRWPWRRASTTP